MPNMPSRKELRGLAGRVLTVPTYTPEDLGFTSFARGNKVFLVNTEHREIIAQALIFWGQHHA